MIELKVKHISAGPRITHADIEANIDSEYYFTAADGFFGANIQHGQIAIIPDGVREKPDGPLGLLTFCVLVLRNGSTVTGESGCAFLENFDAEIGRKVARQIAVDKVWMLMGYELKSLLNSKQP